jgi:transcriptional regulator of NAD metabolism
MAKKQKRVVITVEYVIDDPKFKVKKKKCRCIASEVEQRLHNPELAKYLWTLGTYHDTVVTHIVEVTQKNDD